jgi:hypothetical protein
MISVHENGLGLSVVELIPRRVMPFTNNGAKYQLTIDLLHKSDQGEALADKNPDLTDKSGRKCFAPTAKNRLLQEV